MNSYNLPGNQNESAEKDPVMTSAMIAKLIDLLNLHSKQKCLEYPRVWQSTNIPFIMVQNL